MYHITYRKSAIKTLAKMPRPLSEKFTRAFAQLASEDDGGLDIKKLAGREGFRLRIGGYRALYKKLDGMLVIEVINIGIRGDIYK